MTTFDQAPGSFTAFSGTDVLLVGPHNRLERNGLIFNDRSLIECFWVDDLAGFESPDVNVSAQQNVQETGELPDPGFHGGRTMTMTGWVQAGSYPQLLRMGRQMLDSLIDLVEMPMSISVADASYFSQPEVTIDCRPADKPQLATQIQASDLSGIIRRSFTVALRASDPTYKGATLHHTSLEPLTVSIPGRPYDRVYDLAYNELMDLTGTVVTGGGANVVTVNNAGNWNASVVIRATGAMGGITVVNETTGQAMYFTNIDAGDYIEVDTHPRRGTVVDQDGVLRSSLLDSRSDWISLKGVRNGSDGSNRIVLYVEDYDPDALLELWWRDTYI